MTAPDELLVITPTDEGFSVVGEIDAHTAPSLAAAIAGDGRSDLLLDMAGVEFVDSSGLRVLIDAHQQALEQGNSLTLASPSDAVRRLLDISGVEGYLNIDG